MTTNQELQDNYIPAVLYYCGVTNSDATRYFEPYLEQLSPLIGELGLNGNYEWVMATWEIKEYSMPSNATLQIPTLADILTFYRNAYQNPYNIRNSQPFLKLTSTEIAALETTILKRTDLVTDVTLDKIVYFSNSQWHDLY